MFWGASKTSNNNPEVLGVALALVFLGFSRVFLGFFEFFYGFSRFLSIFLGFSKVFAKEIHAYDLDLHG